MCSGPIDPLSIVKLKYVYINYNSGLQLKTIALLLYVCIDIICENAYA